MNIKQGASAELYYNLGNAYYRTENITRAVLNYERALLLSPGDADIRFNLQLARSKTIDKIVPESEMFFVTWYRSLVNLMSVDGWGRVGTYGPRVAGHRYRAVPGLPVLGPCMGAEVRFLWRYRPVGGICVQQFLCLAAASAVAVSSGCHRYSPIGSRQEHACPERYRPVYPARGYQGGDYRQLDEELARGTFGRRKERLAGE